MAKIKPLAAYLFNKEKIDDISKVTCPPYDVISESDREELLAKSPFNIVRMILGKESDGDNETSNRYTRAKEILEEFIAKDILVKDTAESLYLYRQDYAFAGKNYSRFGFFTLVQIEAFGEKGILPHERTHSGPKEDRFRLMKATGANLSPIFGVYADSGNDILESLKTKAKEQAYYQVDDGRTKHYLWKMQDKKLIESVCAQMETRKIFIADGHHRYETSLRYRDYRRSLLNGQAPPAGALSSDYTLMYLTSFDDEGLSIFSTHRLIKDIKNLTADEIIRRVQDHFDTRLFETKEQFLKTLAAEERNPHHFGIYLNPKKFIGLKLKADVDLAGEIDAGKPAAWVRLGVNILHKMIFKLLEFDPKEGDIDYTPYPDDAIDAVDGGRYQAAFFLSPTKPEEIRDVAQCGLRMPEKSTFFYPKLLTGLLVNKHQDKLRSKSRFL